MGYFSLLSLLLGGLLLLIAGFFFFCPAGKCKEWIRTIMPEKAPLWHAVPCFVFLVLLIYTWILVFRSEITAAAVAVCLFLTFGAVKIYFLYRHYSVFRQFVLGFFNARLPVILTGFCYFLIGILLLFFGLRG